MIVACRSGLRRGGLWHNPREQIVARRISTRSATMKKQVNIDTASDSQLVGINDACTILAISRATFYRLVKANKIRLIKIGSGSKASIGDLRRLIGAVA